MQYRKVIKQQEEPISLLHIIQKAKSYGMSSLSPCELISLVTGIEVEKVKVSIDTYKTIKDTLYNIDDIRGQAAFHLCKRAFTEDIDSGTISSPEIAAKYCIAQLSHLQEEAFCALYMDGLNRLITFKEITNGSIDASIVCTRKVIRNAINLRCRRIILTHNHPCGNPEPSDDDIKATYKISEAVRLFNIILTDHIIVYGNSYTSFVNRGLVSPNVGYNQEPLKV